MLEIKIDYSYIIDSIIKVKEKRFGESFTTNEEYEFVRNIISAIVKQTGFNPIYEKTDNIDNFFNTKGLIMSHFNKKIKINNAFLEKLIYDEELIFYSIYEYKKQKLISCIEKKCENCSAHCNGGLSNDEALRCKAWSPNVENINSMHEMVKKLEKTIY